MTQGSYILDASALLALLRQEPGEALVRQRLQQDTCLISAVNWAEVVGKLAEGGRPADEFLPFLATLAPDICPFDEQQATECGLLRPLTRHLGLSLGDRACLALARLRGATAITADRAWLPLATPLGIAIESIRP